MHGASNISAYAFANYGVFFCSNFDFEEGYKMGKIAKAMMQRFDSNEVSGNLGIELDFIAFISADIFCQIVFE